jgi:hypothetical protein
LSSKPFPTAFAALALGGLSLAALATSQGANGPLNLTPEDFIAEDNSTAPGSICALSVEPSGQGALLIAMVEPQTSVSGSFALKVSQSTGGNRSSIRQGGHFVAPAGQSTVLSKSMFGSMSGIEADLRLTINGAVYDCAYPAGPMDT